MPIYKDEHNGTWFVQFSYTDWTGSYKSVKKRGFKTRKEAVKWESEARLSVEGNTDMTFRVFVETQYLPYITKRVKESTMQTKMNILNKHILPYFGDRVLKEIDTKDIIKWHDTLLEVVDEKTKKKYKPVFLKTVHNQLTACFNHAVRFFGLPRNPAALVGNLGSDTDIKTNCWSLEQMKAFSKYMQQYPRYFYYFELLLWLGIREGEGLALTPRDINWEEKTLSISKTYYVLNGEEHITSPKTRTSNRIIPLPDFLVEELREYMKLLYDVGPDDRLFCLSKSKVTMMLKKAARDLGLPEIRVHDLRHSSLTAMLGSSARIPPHVVAKLAGHSSMQILNRYTHVLPEDERNVAITMNILAMDEKGKEEK